MKRLIYCLAILCTFWQVSHANSIDSLKAIKVKSVSEKVKKYTEIAWAFKEINLDSAFHWAFKANKLINKNVKSTTASYHFHILGALYSWRGEYEASYKWFYKAYLLRKEEKDKNEFLTTLINLVYTCQGLGDVEKMQKFCLEAEKLCIELDKNGSQQHLTILCQLCDVYTKLKRFDKAENCMKLAVREAEKKDNDYNKAVVYHNYGTFLVRHFKFKDAMPFFEKAIVIARKLKDDVWLADLKFNLGIIYAETGRLDEAENIFKESYDVEMAKPSAKADNYAKSISCKNISYVAIKKNQLEKGMQFLNESLLYAQKAGANDFISDRYMSISEVLERQGKFKESLVFRKKYETLKDSIFNLETAKQLNELSEKFDTEKKEKSILLLSKKNADIKVKELESKKALADEKAKSTRRNILFVSLFFIVLLIAGFIYYSLIQKRKAHLKLEEKNQKIELQHTLLEEKQKEIIDSINYAKRIQQSLLPSKKYIRKSIDRLKDKNI